MTKPFDILLGSAHVPVHLEGGWAIPGGGRTLDRDVARTVASNLAKLIGDKAPVTSMNPPIILRKATQSRQDRFSSSDL